MESDGVEPVTSPKNLQSLYELALAIGGVLSGAKVTARKRRERRSVIDVRRAQVLLKATSPTVDKVPNVGSERGMRGRE